MLDISINIDGIITSECDTKEKIKSGLKMFKDAGINYLDCNCAYNQLSCTDKWIDNFKNALAETEMKVGQTHTPILGQINTERGSAEWRMSDDEKKRAETAFKSTAEWGCKNTVVHPHTAWPSWNNKEFTLYRQMNIDFFKYMLEFAYKYNVNICLETLAPLHGMRNYCDNPAELKELHDVLNDEKIKYCVDTGHVNLSGYDIAETIKMLGSDVSVLHMQDNFKTNDGHCLPPFGNTDWKSVAKALTEIGYSGTLNFEINGVRMHFMDNEAKLSYLKFACEMGMFIKRLMK